MLKIRGDSGTAGGCYSGKRMSFGRGAKGGDRAGGGGADWKGDVVGDVGGNIAGRGGGSAGRVARCAAVCFWPSVYIDHTCYLYLAQSRRRLVDRVAAVQLRLILATHLQPHSICF